MLRRRKIIKKDIKYNKYIVSYPRSGNHLVRFFVEILTETPTNPHCLKDDKPIYKNSFPKKVFFNIKEFEKEECYIKIHFFENLISKKEDKMIFILRNPKEVLLRHPWLYGEKNKELNYKYFEKYFKLIDDYNQFKGKKKYYFFMKIY